LSDKIKKAEPVAKPIEPVKIAKPVSIPTHKVDDKVDDAEDNLIPVAVNANKNDDAYSLDKKSSKFIDFVNDIASSIHNFNSNIGVAKMQVFLGFNKDNKPLFWIPSETPHVIITGSSGSGKTSILHSILAHLSNYSGNDVRYIIIDMKNLLPKLYNTNDIRDNNNKLTLDPFEDDTFNVDKFIRILNKIEHIIENRRKLGAEYNLTNDIEFELCKKDGIETFKNFKRIFLVIDEFPALLAAADVANAQIVVDKLRNIGNIGRAFGVHIVISSNTIVSTSLNVNIQPLIINMGLCYVGVRSSQTVKANINIPPTQKNLQFTANFDCKNSTDTGNTYGNIATIDFDDGKKSFDVYKELLEIIQKKMK
jgi:energy-coupling factor transporter ATP-binding protein EcfA2